MKPFHTFTVLPWLCLLIFLAACNEDEQMSSNSKDIKEYSYRAACQSDTLLFRHVGNWKVEAMPEWATLGISEGEGDIVLPLYIQENNDDRAREGIIKIILDGGRKLEITIIQDADESNGYPLVDLPRSYGLGWGYDLKEDYADISGVRGQIIDHASLINDWGEESIVTEVSTVTNMTYVKAQSSETLQQEISGRVTGNVDLKVASAKVSVEYNKQISEQKERLYVWCRDYRGVKKAYFDNDVDILDSDVARWCTTYSFQLSVRNDSPENIVKKFGTHLIIQTCLGGKLDYYFTVSSSLTTEVEKIITAVNVKILCFKASHTWVDEEVWTEAIRDFDGSFSVSGGGEAGDCLNTQLRLYASKGEPLTDPTLFDKWYERFMDAGNVKPEDLAMIDFKVIPIWSIIKRLNAEKGREVEEYVTKDYLR